MAFVNSQTYRRPFKTRFKSKLNATQSKYARPKGRKWPAGRVAKRAKQLLTSRGVTGKALRRTIEGILMRKFKNTTAARIAGAMAEAGFEETLSMGSKTAAALRQPIPGLAGSAKLIPGYSNTVMSLTSGRNATYTARMYKTLFVAGQRPTKTMKNLMKNRGVTTRFEYKSINQQLDDTLRRQLTLDFGFNQKLQAIYSNFFTVEELNTLFEASDYTTALQASQIIYGNIISTKTRHTITNNNSYLPVNVKVKWCRLVNPGEALSSTFIQSCNTPSGSTLIKANGAIPLYQQLKNRNVSAFRSEVFVDPTAPGLWASDIWKAQVQVVKTFSKKLMAGDSWRIDYVHRFGPGVRIDKLNGQFIDGGLDNTTPINYFPVFEYKGIPVEGYKSDDINYRLNGTGPGLISQEHERSILGVQRSYGVQDYDNDGASAGVRSQNFGVRIYSRDVLPHGSVARIKNYNFEDIITSFDTPSASQIVIPVMSDKFVNYSQEKT